MKRIVARAAIALVLLLAALAGIVAALNFRGEEPIPKSASRFSPTSATTSVNDRGSGVALRRGAGDASSSSSIASPKPSSSWPSSLAKSNESSVSLSGC